MKKIISCLLVIAMLATMIPAVALSTFALTDIPADAQTVKVNDKDFTVIRSKADLEAQIEGGNLTKNLIFANDIDMEGSALKGQIAQLNNATIDGNGHSIFNFSLYSNKNDVSLFGVTGTAEFRNLSFGKPSQYIQVTGDNENGKCAGVVLSYTNSTTVFENVNVYANIVNTTVNYSKMGMFIGGAKGNHTFRNCNAYGSVKASGGTQWAIGGFIGEAMNEITLNFENCSNHATVTGGEKSGGFVGLITTSKAVTFKNCANHGDITGEWNSGCFIGKLCPANSGTPVFELDGCTNYGKMTGINGEVAGIIGHLNADSDNNTGFKLTLKNCTNFGAIEAAGQHVSGMISRIRATKTTSSSDIDLIDCVNYGMISGKGGRTAGMIAAFEGTSNAKNTFDMVGCKNYGSVVGTQGDSGAMFAYFDFIADEMTISNCANFGALTGAGTAGGVCGSVALRNSNSSLKINHFLNKGNLSASGKVAGVLANVWCNPSTATAEIDHCVNLGNLTSNGDLVGGIVSDNKDGIQMTVNNCLNAGTVSTTGEAAFGYVIGSKNGTVTGSNNSYMANGNANTELGTTVLADWNAVLTAMNTDYATVFGAFKLNDSGDGVVFAAPKLSGVQESKIENGEFDIRLVATINAASYSSVGFKITLNDSTEVNQLSCRTIFTKLLANDDGNMISYTAGELGGAYIYALNVTGLSASETYTLHVTPYAVDLDGETVYDGTSYTITYVNGVYVGAAAQK